jgi:ATP-dependent helicase/nuclease subunit B
VDAVDTATYDLKPCPDGRVLVSTVMQARGVPKDFVFLGGLVEGEFPLRAAQDPLLTVEEREALATAGVTLAWRGPGDEATMFYEAVALARVQLFLSRPQFDEQANPLFPSPYLGSLKELLDAIPEETLPLNYSPAPHAAACLSELAVSLTPGLKGRDAEAIQLDRTLVQVSAAWRHSLFAREIESRRESSSPFDEYAGLVSDPTLKAEFETKFGPRYFWSASQLNLWGSCGFRFFAKRLLQLEEIAEPEEGLTDLQLGALYHKILEDTYGELRKRSIAVTPANLDQALLVLRTMAMSIIAQAPTRYAFRPTAWWQAEQGEILRRLTILLTAEAERNGADACPPLAVEIPFGFQETSPLKLCLPVGTVNVRGKIDRIDQKAAGCVLIDYKTGTTPIGPGEVIQGRNLQLPIYVLAAESMGYRVADAYFLHIKNGETSGNLTRVDREGWLTAAKDHINGFVSQARAGLFSVYPKQFENGDCSARCEFECLCRVGRWCRDKPLAGAQG